MKEQLKALLSGFAPGLATTLAGPYAGMAVSFLAKKFLGDAGGDPGDLVAKVKAAVDLARTDPKERIRLAEMSNEFTLEMRRLGIREHELNLADTANARSLAMSQGTETQSFVTYAVLAVWLITNVVVVALAIFATMSGQDFDQATGMIVMGILRTLDAALIISLQFWFGSSKGSKDKSAYREKVF